MTINKCSVFFIDTISYTKHSCLPSVPRRYNVVYLYCYQIIAEYVALLSPRYSWDRILILSGAITDNKLVGYKTWLTLVFAFLIFKMIT